MTTAREWQAGDVAMVTEYGHPVVALVRQRGKLLEFAYPDGGFDVAGPLGVDGVDEVAARPLVTIDPEDREQARALVAAIYGAAYPFDARIDAAQATLRELANPKPPKPAEPQGLGAVAEDTEGRLWVRSDSLEPEWRCASDPIWECWPDIDVARVLSEGLAS